MIRLWEYKLEAETLCLGERNKKGTYRASISSCIPYSQITGALRAQYGGGEHEFDLHGVGRLTDFGRKTIVQGVRDRVLDRSTLPIEAEILVNVTGRVYIPINDYTEHLPDPIQELKLGAFRSRGVGRCKLTKCRGGAALEIEEDAMQQGRLAVRLPDDPAVLSLFGIQKTLMPVYGYLFRPDEQHVSGQYVRALFEGSIVRGPKVLVQ
jgi:hypothetical protein